MSSKVLALLFSVGELRRDLGIVQAWVSSVAVQDGSAEPWGLCGGAPGASVAWAARDRGPQGTALIPAACFDLF